jgi:hypothetical protein
MLHLYKTGSLQFLSLFDVPERGTRGQKGAEVRYCNLELYQIGKNILSVSSLRNKPLLDDLPEQNDWREG